MDRITRKGLKTDKFAAEVSHTVEYVTEHKRQVTIVGCIVAALLVAGMGTYVYRRHQHSARQEALRAAMLLYEASVGPASPNSPTTVTFPTQAEKSKAVHKTLGELANKYPGTDEAAIATYYLGAYSSDQGNLGEAEKDFKQVIESGKQEYASLAKLSLAKVYQAQGKTADAEKLLRSLVANPTMLVSKQQATIALAELLAPTKPEEARKLLEPLRTDRSPVSRAALNVLARIPNDK